MERERATMMEDGGELSVGKSGGRDHMRRMRPRTKGTKRCAFIPRTPGIQPLATSTPNSAPIVSFRRLLSRCLNTKVSPYLNTRHGQMLGSKGFQSKPMDTSRFMLVFSLKSGAARLNDNDLVMKWVLITRLPPRLPFPLSRPPLLSSLAMRNCHLFLYFTRRERKSNGRSSGVDGHMSPPPPSLRALNLCER